MSKKDENPEKEWNRVIASLVADFNIKNIEYFLIKLVKSGLIEECYSQSDVSPIYTSTSYFERLFELIPEIDKYHS